MEFMQKIRGVSEAAPGRGRSMSILRSLSKRPRITLIIFVVVAVLAVLAYIATQSKTPEEKAQQELAAAVVAVGKLMNLPEGDEPVLATVTDADTLIKQQAFFSGSVNGDQLLLFPKSLKAIIYSPSRHKIINAGPIEQSGAAGQSAPVSAAAPATVSSKAISVEVRNGTGVAGLGAEVAEKIRTLPGFEVTKVADATSKDNHGTVMVSRVKGDTGTGSVQHLAATVGADVVESIPGEPVSRADVLIVLGTE